MGMNYYLRHKEMRAAYLKGRSDEEELCASLLGEEAAKKEYAENSCPEHYTSDESNVFHIGKSSYGWFFHLCAYPEIGIEELKDWRKAWSDPNYEIVDELDRVVSPTDMEKTILDRHGNVTPEEAAKEQRSEEESNAVFGYRDCTCGYSPEYGLLTSHTGPNVFGRGWVRKGKEGPYDVSVSTDFS
jgi:hypothetical protein